MVMLRKLLLVSVLVLVMGSVAQAQYWTLESIVGGRTAYFSGNAAQTLVVGETSPGVYSTTFAGAVDNKWWGPALSDWDRDPEPYGLNTYSFTWAGQSLDYGMETLVLSNGNTPEVGEVVWNMTIPTQGLANVAVDFFGQYVEILASADGTSFTSVGTRDAGWGPLTADIPLGLLDTTVPGESSLFVKYRGFRGPGAAYCAQTLTAEVPEPATILLLVSGIAGLLARRRR